MQRLESSSHPPSETGVNGSTLLAPPPSVDFWGAEELAARMKKTLPPGLVPPKPGEPQSPPMPPPPQVQVMIEKSKTEQLKQQVQIIKLYKETKETDKEIRQQIIQVLKELHSPVHPADELQQTAPLMTETGGIDQRREQTAG